MRMTGPLIARAIDCPCQHAHVLYFPLLHWATRSCRPE